MTRWQCLVFRNGCLAMGLHLSCRSQGGVRCCFLVALRSTALHKTPGMQGTTADCMAWQSSLFVHKPVVGISAHSSYTIHFKSGFWFVGYKGVLGQKGLRRATVKQTWAGDMSQCVSHDMPQCGRDIHACEVLHKLVFWLNGICRLHVTESSLQSPTGMVRRG